LDGCLLGEALDAWVVLSLEQDRDGTAGLW